MDVIDVSGVNKSFGKVRAVVDLRFKVAEAECHGFLGPNGAGKTTMMKIIYGKTERNNGCEGEVNVFGYDPCRDELAIKYLSGVVQQEDNLDDELNVIQNLKIYARFYDLPKNRAKQRIEELLDFMELKEKAHSKIRELSGGMKRRLVIARALLHEPKLLILDEPTTGLDPQVRHLIWEKLRELKRKGVTILLTTHYMEEAFQLCDVVLIMHKGEKIMEGRPYELLSDNIEAYVLEVLDKIRAEEIEPRVNEDIRVDKSHEVPRFYSQNVEGLRSIAEDLPAGSYHLRQSNLEDVFLKATGRKLNEYQ